MPLRSRVGNALTRVAFHLLSRTKVADTQTGLRAFGFSQLTYLLETEGSGYDYEMNVLLHCKRHGIPLVEVPIQTVYLDEHNSASHFHSLRDSWKVLKMLLKFASVSLISFALDYGLFLLLSTGNPAVCLWPAVQQRCGTAGQRLFQLSAQPDLGVSLPGEPAQNLGGIPFAGDRDSPGQQRDPLAVCLWPVPSAVLAKLLTEGSLFLVSLTVQTKVIFRGGGGCPQRKGR